MIRTEIFFFRSIDTFWQAKRKKAKTKKNMTVLKLKKTGVLSYEEMCTDV